MLVFNVAGVVAARAANGNSNRPNSFAGNKRAATVHNDRPPSPRADNLRQPNDGNRPNLVNPNYGKHPQTMQASPSHNGPNNPNVNRLNNNYPNGARPGAGHPGNQHLGPENHPQPLREHEPGHPGR